MRAKLRTMASLAIDDEIEDILITLNRQYDVIRLLKSPAASSSSTWPSTAQMDL